MRWQSLSLSFASVIENRRLAAPPHFSHPWAPLCSSALTVEAATDAAPSSHRCCRPRAPSSPSSRASSLSHCTMKNSLKWWVTVRLFFRRGASPVSVTSSRPPVKPPPPQLSPECCGAPRPIRHRRWPPDHAIPLFPTFVEHPSLVSPILPTGPKSIPHHAWSLLDSFPHHLAANPHQNRSSVGARRGSPAPMSRGLPARGWLG
jgi:hypothetical protein